MATIVPVNLDDLESKVFSELNFSKLNPNAFLVIPNTEEFEKESPLVRAIISELEGMEIIPFTSVRAQEILRVKK